MENENDTEEQSDYRRIIRSLTNKNVTKEHRGVKNMRITRIMSRENQNLAPNINYIVEFAMEVGTDNSYTSLKNFQ